MGKDADKQTPFERFQELTKKIVSVPKKEIDEQAKKPLKRRPKRA